MAEVDHTHTSIIQGGMLRRAALESGTTSLSGTAAKVSVTPPPPFVINTFTIVSLALTAWCLYPMFHSSGNSVMIVGHITDGADPDAPRLGLANISTSADETYDIDYRYLTA